MRDEIILLSFLSILIFSAVALGYAASDDIESAIRGIRQKDVSTPDDCKNLTMRETAYCLHDYVGTIFRYKLRDDIENPSLDELIEEGGDCLNWADLYVQHIENLGFHAKRPIFDIGNETAHTFAIISDDTGYCILDQTAIECFELGDSSLANEAKTI